jgi:S1-C subfamily serine protease
MKFKCHLLLSALLVIFLNTSANAENWVLMAKDSDAEAFRDNDSIRVENGLNFVKQKLALNKPSVSEGFTFHVVVYGFAINCNQRTAAYTDISYLDDGKILNSVDSPREKWKFSSEIYEKDARFVNTVCTHPATESSPVFAEDQHSKQAELDWHNTIDNFLHEVKVTEGFDYYASANASLYKSLDLEVKKLGNNKEYWNKDSLFFLCEAHKKVMRQFNNANYELVKLGNLCTNHSASPTLSKLDSLKDRASKGDASAQYTLGLMLYNGKGVPKDVPTAIGFLQAAAIQNHVGAQNALSSIYRSGNGTPKNETKAFEWSQKAASQGDSTGQLDAGMFYMQGVGVIRDDIRAYAWLNLAAAQGEKTAIEARDYLEQSQLTANQRAEGQRLSSNWKKGDTFLPTDNKPVTQKPEISDTLGGALPKLSRTGSGFIVSANGALLTNDHVVNGCSILKIRDSSKTEYNVTVVATDARNDLALLQTSTAVSLPVAIFRAKAPAESGESVVALGYPLAGVLASDVNVSFGYVSATAGVADDTSQLQISAPVQPGNSGGPLLDQSGNLIGVVVAKLDAIKLAKAIGDIPQNVNFAIKGEVAQTFLAAHNVEFKTSIKKKLLKNTEISSIAAGFTVLVECYK